MKKHLQSPQLNLYPVKKQKLAASPNNPAEDLPLSNSEDILRPGPNMTSLLPPSPQDSPTASELPLTYILSLPTEILQDIINLVDDVSHQDTLHFSSTCKNLRAVAKPTIFSKFSLTWTTIDSFINEQLAGAISITPYIADLHIGSPSSWGEWHKNNILGDLISSCPNLKGLNVASSGSSSWLKYIKSVDRETEMGLMINGLRKISVVSRVALENRGLPDNNGLKLPLFNINDLAHFINVDTLHLEGFNVRNEEIMQYSQEDLQNLDGNAVGSNVRNLRLKNCIWEYPFDVQDFGSISQLEVIYTDCYRSFTYSERVRTLAQTPPPTLESFNLHLLGRSPISQKAWHPLTNHKCQCLKTMSIKGFSMPGDSFFHNLPKSLRSLTIELAMFAKQREDFHTDGHIKRCMEKFPNHGIQFNVVTWEDSNARPI